MAARYEAGESYASLAREFGVSKMGVKNAVVRNGGTHRPRGHYATPEAAARAKVVRQRYEAGERLVDIAANVGISFTTARLDVLAAGGETRAKLGTVRPLRGPDNPSWRGGAHITGGGYRAVWVALDDPFRSMAPARTNTVLEHRLVMARSIGRPLLSAETVHHINGDRLDNRLENLQLRSASHGPGVAMRCHDCGSQNVGPVNL